MKGINDMTLYSLIKQISNIITADTDAFYKYVLYTSDDNGGFLRTRYCWWPDKPVADLELESGYSKVLVTSKTKINPSDLLDESSPKVKLQITYSDENATLEEAEWDAQLGYCYVYIFDLVHNTYTLDYVACPYL
ncbi:hypothetical protein [Pseudobutyrivibrio sp. C4]|uniref:hypothetical protein n=1 Tax=Pseudobutyrivibrio sp. C4 TaxID=1520803 RepID=UPI00115F8B44|nr:hypothetical protein [Pseudobutyrivibrio sp. C4]